MTYRFERIPDIPSPIAIPTKKVGRRKCNITKKEEKRPNYIVPYYIILLFCMMCMFLLWDLV